MPTRTKGTHSKYRDLDTADDNWMPHIHRDKRYSARTFTPSDQATDHGGRPGGYSKLAEESLNGDWSWKPERDKALGYDMPSLGIVSFFRTLRASPPSPAEEAAHARHLHGEHGAKRYDEIVPMALLAAA